MRTRLMAIFLFVCLLSGCATTQECVAFVSSGPSITFDGLTWPKNPTEPVKIGRFTYTPQQAKTLGESVASLESYRLGHCRNMRALSEAKGGADATVISAAIKEFNTTFTTLAGNLTRAVRDAPSPDVAVKDAEQTKAQAVKAREAIEVRGSQSGDKSQSNMPITHESSLERDTVKRITDRLDSVERTLVKNGRLQRKTVLVSGFSEAGVSLPAEARQALSSQVREFSSQAPADYLVLATVVGYANASGSRIANVELGLRRAQKVASYLASVHDQLQIQTVASGGIADGSADARRVEVHVWALPRV